MRKLKQSMLVTVLVSAGLLSATICQCSMQMAMAAPPSHHCAPEEENAPVEPCCSVTQAAELRSSDGNVAMPEAVQADLLHHVVASPLQAPQFRQELAHPPPLNGGILHQTCALLI